MNQDHEIDDISAGAKAMSVNEEKAAMWAKASKADTRFTNHELKFSDAVFNESAYSYDIRQPTPDNRPRTADAERLKRKHVGGDGTAKPKKRKTKEETSEERMEERKEDTMDSPHHPDRNQSPAETGIPMTITAPGVQPATAEDLDTPPADTAEFLKWARKDMERYSPGESRRLRGAASMIRLASTKTKGFESALALLRIHAARVIADAREASNMRDKFKLKREATHASLVHLEQFVRVEERRKDLFIKRMNLFETEAKAAV